jgi:hypothetical protein
MLWGHRAYRGFEWGADMNAAGGRESKFAAELNATPRDGKTDCSPELAGEQ